MQKIEITRSHLFGMQILIGISRFSTKHFNNKQRKNIRKSFCAVDEDAGSECLLVFGSIHLTLSKY